MPLGSLNTFEQVQAAVDAKVDEWIETSQTDQRSLVVDQIGLLMQLRNILEVVEEYGFEVHDALQHLNTEEASQRAA